MDGKEIDQILREGVGFRIRKTVWHQQNGKVIKSQFNKSSCYGRDKIKSFDVSQKVWVGGLTDEATWKNAGAC